MEHHPTVYARNHYNKQVKHVSTEQAIKDRKTGVALPLKNFHNEIKRLLIRRFAYNADSLLDLCCGRGGDLHKWKSAEVKYVKGIDLSPAEIQEAERRYQELTAKDPDTALVAEFQCTDQLGLSSWEEPQQYDVVTCMFSLHYFFYSESTLKRFLANVSQNLKPGGYFIGTVPDGKKVLQHLSKGAQYDSPMLKLTKRWEGNPSTFGCAYSCAIADTVTQGVGGSKGSYEFLVFFTPIKHLAAAAGLIPVLSYQDPNLEAKFEKADEKQPFKHFKPSFPGADSSLEQASSLFTAFVFQKVGEGQQVTVPPLPPQEWKGRGRGPPPDRGNRRPFEGGGRGHESEQPPPKRSRPDQSGYDGHDPHSHSSQHAQGSQRGGYHDHPRSADSYRGHDQHRSQPHPHKPHDSAHRNPYQHESERDEHPDRLRASGHTAQQGHGRGGHRDQHHERESTPREGGNNHWGRDDHPNHRQGDGRGQEGRGPGLQGAASAHDRHDCRSKQHNNAQRGGGGSGQEPANSGGRGMHHETREHQEGGSSKAPPMSRIQRRHAPVGGESSGKDKLDWLPVKEEPHQQDPDFPDPEYDPPAPKPVKD